MPAPVLQFKRGNAGVAGTVPALRPGEPAISLNNFDFFIGIDTSVANNKFFGSHRYWTREDGTNSLKLNLVDRGGTNYVAIKAPDILGGNVTYQLPGTQGGNNTVLTNDGSGNLTWGSGSSNPVFSGIATFSDTTDNTLGNSNTGAVQIDGGLGVDKNVTVGGNLNVQGYSNFIGVVTFAGGTINLGDDGGDNINVGGEFTSGLYPNTTNTYDLGDSSRQWKNANFAGIGTFDGGVDANNVTIGISGANTINTSTGKLTLNSYSGVVEVANHLDVIGDLDVTGNVYIGGTSVTLRGTDVFIENKDIVLGYTTTATSNDTTANHAGVAIASTEGTPLVSFSASGINTLPDTYKQMMWFKSGTLGFATDAFGFNYGVAIGTTNMADGVRLAVGTGVTVGDTSVSATNFYGSLVGNVTGNAATATYAETAGIATYATNAGISTQVKTVTAADAAGQYHLTFVDSHNGSPTAETVYTDDGIYYNPGTNTFTTQHANLTGIVTTGQLLYANGGIDVTGHAEIDEVNVSGATTVTSLNATGNVTLGDASGDTVTVKGTATFEQTIVGTIGTATRALNVDVAGVAVNQNYNLVLSDGSGTSKALGVDAELLYNPNTNTFTVGTGVGITQFSASVSTGSSTSSVPTSSAVIDYVGSQFGSIDLTLGLNADTGGPSTVNTSQTLTINGTSEEIETSVSGQTITVGLPNAVVVGTSLSAPTVRANIIQSQNTGATVFTLTADDASVAGDLTIGGNLYVNGNTTQVNTTSLTVEDTLVELGLVDAAVPNSDLNKDLGLLFNYYTDSAKKAAVFWDDSAARIVFADDVTESSSVLTVASNAYASIEIEGLWVNDCAGQSQVITCTGSERFLQNITVDAGVF